MPANTGRGIMKKICTCLLILALSGSAYALKITVSGEVELGTDVESYNTFLDVDLGFNFYFWKCHNYTYVGSRTWFVADWQGLSGYPYREIYYYGNRFYVAGFFIDVQHFCNHPVYSTSIHSKEVSWNNPNDDWWSNVWGDTITTISIGYKFELPVYDSSK